MLHGAFHRNVFSHVPSTRVREVSHMLKAIHAQESRAAADEKARTVIADLRASRMAKAADLVEQAVHETLAYYAFPEIHWRKIRTNNPLERITTTTQIIVCDAVRLERGQAQLFHHKQSLFVWDSGERYSHVRHR